MLSDQKRAALAERLWLAEQAKKPCAPLTQSEPNLTATDAYAIAHINIARHEELGARVVGRKVGLTSEAIQRWLGVDRPDFGALLDTMEIPDGGTLRLDSLLQPRAEGEIAFVLGDDLIGPGVTVADVLAATDFVLPAIEIIDSRVADWKIKFADTVADNASSGRFVLGTTPIAIEELPLGDVGMVLRQRGRVVSTGAGAACLGNPVHAVRWLANTLGALGTPLAAGDVVLSGALGPAVSLTAGDWLELEIARLGRCRFRCL
ncbi:MAG: fumarylacetoacetate hydrolase family protein [Myxococcales bacterium]|nr:fumarylacetoacetate hydrolase family protein [Myxococcales bacterium]